MAYLKLADACLAYGHVPLLDHTDFLLDPGERVALIGRNGTGKSSLLAALAAGSGRGKLDDGEVWVQPGIRVGYVPQEPPFDMDMTVFEAVVSGMGETSKILAAYHEVVIIFPKGRATRMSFWRKWKRCSTSLKRVVRGPMRRRPRR